MEVIINDPARLLNHRRISIQVASYSRPRNMIDSSWHQNNNARSGIVNRFLDQENLQNYAQMHRILLCHWNNTHSIVLTNGKIHLVMFITWY